MVTRNPCTAQTRMSASTDPRLSQRPTWATFTRGIRPHHPNSSVTWQRGSKDGKNGTPDTQNARGAGGLPSQSNTSHKRQPRQQTSITGPPSLTHVNEHGYGNQLPLPTTHSRPTPTIQAATHPPSMAPTQAKLTTLPLWFGGGKHGIRGMGIYGARVAPESRHPRHTTLPKQQTLEQSQKVGGYLGEDTKQQ